MGMEQERNGPGGDWPRRPPGLRGPRALGFGWPRSDGPGRTATWSLHGDTVAVETGVCICRKASRLGSSRRSSTCILHLEKMAKARRGEEKGAEVI